MNSLVRIAIVAAAFAACATDLKAANPAPPSNLIAKDHPNDNGEAIDVTWKLSADDKPNVKPPLVDRYEIYRTSQRLAGQAANLKSSDDEAAEEKGFRKIGEVTSGKKEFTDQNCKLERSYRYRVVAIGPKGERSSPVDSAELITPARQWFDRDRAWYGVLLVLICGTILYYIRAARSGKPLSLRPIPGLQAVDEAVGRATEMGKKCLFIAGIEDISEIQTVAGLTILGRVAQTAAEYDCPVEVPTSRSLVMTAARETLQAAALAAGRPEAYRADLAYYLTDEQFGYVAAVTGTMIRDKPAACFYLGAFYAESLYLAETGNSIGAIQVAGTAESTQLPFFVAACDYVLIGEEFFAASAYLSGEPQQLGTLKGQDVGKFVGGLLLVVGVLSATVYAVLPNDTTKAVIDFLKGSLLG